MAQCQSDIFNLLNFFWSGRGLLAVRKREWDKAIQAYDKAIKLDPKSPTAYSSKGYAQFRAAQESGGSYAEAIKTLEYVTSSEEGKYYNFGHYNLALTFFKDGQQDKAAKEAARALEISPDFCKTFRDDSNFTWFVQSP